MPYFRAFPILLHHFWAEYQAQEAVYQLMLTLIPTHRLGIL